MDSISLGVPVYHKRQFQRRLQTRESPRPLPEINVKVNGQSIPSMAMDFTLHSNAKRAPTAAINTPRNTSPRIVTEPKTNEDLLE